MSRQAKNEDAVERVNIFLHSNYPCGCYTSADCAKEVEEAAEVVRIVLDAYGIGAEDD